jgi:hypothetical protein
MQSLCDPNKRNIHNLNNARREASRHFKKKKKSLKAKIDELQTNSKIKNIRDLYRGIIYFKEGYQHWTNAVKDEKGDLLTDYHGVLARRRNHFSQLLNVREADSITYSRAASTWALVPLR